MNKEYKFQKKEESFMKKNVHSVERVFRIIIGVVLVSLAFVGPANKWFLLGIIPILTGFSGWCLPYQLLGISTCKIDKKN